MKLGLARLMSQKCLRKYAFSLVTLIYSQLVSLLWSLKLLKRCPFLQYGFIISVKLVSKNPNDRKYKWNTNGKETFHLYFTYYSSKVDLAANSHHMHQKQYFYADEFMITAASINYWPWIGFEQVQVQ